MNQQLYTEVYTQNNWKRGQTKNAYGSVHSNIIHNSQKVETTEVSIS